uniref:UTP3 small subunit processome component n=1 Tax=Sphenodon punctatus TaxID=8508 RepID=A0A8D0GJW6_SPHPU
MVRSRRSAASGQRRPEPAREEEELEEPDPSALSLVEEADELHERRLDAAVMGALDSEEEPGSGEEEEQEEVLGLHLPEDSTEDEEDGEGEEKDEGEEGGDEPLDMDSDLEEPGVARGSGLPHELSWGQRKQLYYDTDYGASAARPKAPKRSQEEVDAEEQEEEQEAKAVQKRLVQSLGEDDYGLELVQAYAAADQPSEETKGRKITKDLQTLSKKEQLKLLKLESPELLQLIQDFEAKLTELKDELDPLMQMVKEGFIPEGKGSHYVQTKYHLYLNYCFNVSFYLLLKAKRIPVHGHPVIERLVTYRNLINDLGIVDQKLLPEVRLLLKEFHSSERDDMEPKRKLIRVPRRPTKNKSKSVPKTSNAQAVAKESPEDSDLDEESALQYYREVQEKLKLKRKRKVEKNGVEVLVEEEEDPNKKRGVTYQIVKNKGLTPKRKKIRRKGQVREVRKEEHRYGGELSGIRAGVKKSIKLK